MTTLNKVPKGKKAKAIQLENDVENKTLLTGFGILPGDELIVAHSSFLGSPMTIELSSGEFVAMRSGEAAQIKVEMVD